MYSKKQWAQYHDNKLMELAMYYVTEGLTQKVKDAETVYEKFSEFKRLVVRGSFTIQQLEDSVYEKYGIMPQRSGETLVLPFLKALADLAESEKQRKKDEESS